jgi:hypothetical protein
MKNMESNRMKEDCLHFVLACAVTAVSTTTTAAWVPALSGNSIVAKLKGVRAARLYGGSTSTVSLVNVP